MDTYLTPIPVGLNPPLPTSRKPVLRFFNGDKIVVRTLVHFSDGCEATPENSRLTFNLAGDQFQRCPIWEGLWRAGIERNEKMVEVTVPDEVSASLVRGSYLFSLLLSDPTGANPQTVLEGTLLIEYAPTSKSHDIPYKDVGWNPETLG